jgi:hypothetical protein
MSAIDRKLHLFGAQKGFWQIDESHKIEYNDLNGDDFVDSWTYYDGDEAIQTLFSTERFLIHFGPGTTRIVAAEVPQALFEARPPTTHADWLLLNEQLARHQHVFPAGDLLPMLNQFDGPALTVSEATGKDFRFTEEGFRFVIEPKSQMRLVVDGGIELPGFTDLARPYVIEYVDGSLSAEALTQPALRLDANMLNTVPPQMEEMVIGQVRVLVYNAGLADAHDVVIEAVFSQAAHTELITTTLSLAPGQGYAEAEFDWAPPKAGAWDMAISFDSEGSGGEQALASSVRIQVLPADRVSPLDLIRLDAAEETGWAIAGLFFSIVAAAGATGVLIWRGLVRQ